MRAPTEQEKDELARSVTNYKYLKPTEEDYKEEREYIDNIWICVFDDYITDGPGYAGRVMVVVWGGDPSFTESYIWYNNKLEKLRIEQ